MPTAAILARGTSSAGRKGKRNEFSPRMFEPGVRYTEASIGRVVTAQAVRGTGVGRKLMAEALRRVDALVPGEKIKLAAQRRLEEFYAEFGFTTVSAPYEEDGIIHIDMVR